MNFSDLLPLAEKYSIPLFLLDEEKSTTLKNFEQYFSENSFDFCLVAGWYHMIPKFVRNSCKLGAWGLHASLLPNYAGGAPLSWAIINGEKESGVTLFKLSDGVDDGDIIAQESFSIEHDETIKEIYKKATDVSKTLLSNAFKNVNELKYTPQNKKLRKRFPQRKPDDGEINLNSKGIDIYNFIRAQSDPYPGAFIRTNDGKKIIIEKARIE